MLRSQILFLLLSFASQLSAQNYSLVWSDSFNNGAINTSNWIFESGTGSNGWGNNELQYYTSRPENATIINNQLCIIARKEPYQGSDYTSARIISKGKQAFTYGKMEARIKLPQTQGLWPAFWMLGSNIDQVSWPSCGEIDIMEHINLDPKVHGTIHWNSGGHQYYGGSTNCNVGNYHLYSIEWTPDEIIWYLDNVQYWTANIKNNINNTEEFHKPFFFIMNMAVGGNWPGSPTNASIFPDTMYVDYINVYQKLPNSIVEANTLNQIKVYPNPADDVITIDLSESDINRKVPIMIYNTLGQCVIKQNVPTGMQHFTIKLDQLAPGIYAIQYGNQRQSIFVQ